MEDNNTSIFTQSKIEYTNQLIDVLTTPMFDGIISIYDESKRYYSTQTNLSILSIFRTFLAKVPEWNNELVEKETERIVDESKCDWLDDLVTAVFICHTKILTSIGTNINNVKINLTIPKTINFIHKCYINLAREIWKNPYLFYENNSGSEYQKNMRTIELIIKESIENTIRKLLPVKDILKEHLDNFDNENKIKETNLQETLLQEIRSLKKNYTPDNSDNSDNSDNDDNDISPNVDEKSPNTDINEKINTALLESIISKNSDIPMDNSDINKDLDKGYESPDEEKIKKECENIEITTVPDITSESSNTLNNAKPLEEMKYDNVDIINPEKTNSDLMDNFKNNLQNLESSSNNITNNSNDILSPRINTISDNVPLNNDPLFNISNDPIKSIVPEVKPIEPEIKSIVPEVKSIEPEVKSIVPEVKSNVPEVNIDPNIKDVVMNKQNKTENQKEITIVKKDTETKSTLGSINENTESKTTELNKYNPEEKEKELKEIVSVEVNNDDTETVDNFVNDLNNIMKNKGIEVDKNVKKYTLFDDAPESE